MEFFKGILFFRPRTLQKQTNELSAAGWVLPATWDVYKRLTWIFHQRGPETNLFISLLLLLLFFSKAPTVHYSDPLSDIPQIINGKVSPTHYLVAD